MSTLLETEPRINAARAPSRPTWKRRECYELADDLIEKSIEAERTFLACMWFDPFAAHEAACDAGLMGATFTTAAHSLLFWYLATCHESDRPAFIDEAVTISNTVPDADWQRCELQSLFEETEITDGAAPLYAEAVADFHRKRVEAQECLKRFAELGAGDEYMILVRPKNRSLQTASIGERPTLRASVVL